MIWWIAYAVTVVIAYAVIRLWDDDEDEMLCVVVLYWVMAAVWPITLVGFSVIALIGFILMEFDRFLFWIKDGVTEKIKTSIEKRRGSAE